MESLGLDCYRLRRFTRAVGSAISLLSLPVICLAQTQPQGLDWELSLTQAFTDNIGIVAADPIEEYPLSASGEVSWLGIGRRTESDIRLAAQRIEYWENTLAGESRVQLDADIAYALAPERLTVRISDFFTQEPIDVRDPINPSNNQDINVFQAGLELTLPFGTMSRLDLLAGHSQSQAEVTNEFDSDNNNGSIAWVFLPSSRTELSIHGDFRKVEFDNITVNDDYDRRDSYVSARFDRGPTELSMEAGRSSVEFMTTGQALDDPDLFRFSIERAIGTNRRFFAEYHDSLTDAATALADRSPTDVGTAIVSGDIFLERGWSAEFEGGWTSGVWSLLAASTDEKGFINPLVDRESSILQGQMSFDLAPRLSMIVSASAAEYEFPDIGRTDKERRGVTAFLFNMTANMVVSLEVGHTAIDSTDAVFNSNETTGAISISISR